MSKHKSFYQSEFLPAERKDLAQAAASQPGSPGLKSTGPSFPLLAAPNSLPAQVSSELIPVQGLPAAPLADEIGLLKVTIRRMFALSKEQPAEEAVKTLAQLSAVTARLASIVRTQQLILNDLRQRPGKGDSLSVELSSMLLNVLAEVQQDWPLL
jgi:hypothetical protein